MSLEQLEALATEYERQYLEATGDINALAIRSVNDISLTVDSVKNVLDYYIESSQPTDELTAKSGALYSKTSIVGKGRKSRQKVVAGIKIPDTAFANYLEKCFSCEGRIRFTFEMMPSGQFFAQLENILNEIERAIQSLLNAFKPNDKFIMELCALLNMLANIACPQDLIGLALALQMLISSQMSAFLSIKLNWWGLFGFAIKWFMDLLANLIEQLANMLEAPLKCLRSAMIAGLETLRAFDKAFETKENDGSGNAVIKLDPQTQRLAIKLSGNAFMFPDERSYPVANYQYDVAKAMTKSVVIPTDYVSRGNETNGSFIGSQAANEFYLGSLKPNEEIPVGKYVNSGNTIASTVSNAPSRLAGPTVDGIIVGDVINSRNTYQPVSLPELTLPEQILALTNESIEYIENLKVKILEALAGVSLIVKNNKVLEIKTLVNVKFLMSIISLLIYLGQLDNLKDICKTDGSKAPLEKVLKQILNSDDVKVIGNGKNLDISYSVNGEVKQTQMASCLTAKYEADSAVERLNALLEEFSK